MSVPTEYLDENHIRNRIKKLSKNHEDEIVAALNNLEKAMIYFAETGVDALRNSGLVRRESSGILAVDQSGCKRKPPCQIRLYFYVTDAPKRCFLLTLGDKRTQQEDNNRCKDLLKKAGLIGKRK